MFPKLTRCNKQLFIGQTSLPPVISQRMKQLHISTDNAFITILQVTE